MVSLDVRDELYCSICLGIYKDPVTLACGHSFCENCITCVLDAQKASKVYFCPACRGKFQQRPRLLKNVSLRNIAERFLSVQQTEPPEEDSEVFCTYCDPSVAAVKTCLRCEASLCAKHLQKHRNSPEHVLVNPTTSLDHRKCFTHQEVLRFYCTKDSTCICVTCRLDGDHQGHAVESLDEAAEKKKQTLRNLLQNMTSSRAEAEKTVQRLYTEMKCVQDKAAEKRKKVSAIFSVLRIQLDDLEEKVLNKISKQEKRVSCSISDVIKQLELQVDELHGKMGRIEELCDLTDPLTVLQESKKKELYNVGKQNDRREDDCLNISHTNLDEIEIVETLHEKISNIITLAKKEIYFPCNSYTLDRKTAAKSLLLSQNRKMASWVKTPSGSSCEDSPERFQDCSQVLSTLGFNSGEYFWETEMSECGEWRLGVCYGSIDRKGDPSYLGCNDKSWCLSKSSNNRYSVIHDKREIILSHNISCNRFRVYLDYKAGQVSFYELSNLVRHLYTFTATFTEPLYAAFYVFGSNASVKITT
ncbi:E3 ubiquitin/ISG15 ligase TRIM25-like [Pyxicephalus adspersus]|uniref:Uncharacterized protein n=1 Tax=Pyxicephalus adspersus TaxID=30357 RepID=A0AAV3AQB5_PYXAD|nr:TPA: hypothetical protein GDO54_007970 [Pyxicephalus adspersus]